MRTENYDNSRLDSNKNLSLTLLFCLVNLFAFASITPTSEEINIKSCDLLTDFCLSIPSKELRDYIITDNGETVSDFFTCDFTATKDDQQLEAKSISVKLSEGFHLLEVTNVKDQSVKSYNVNITCDTYKPDCLLKGNFFEAEKITISSTGSKTAFVIDIPLDELVNYNIYVNDKLYNGKFEPTGAESIIAYSVEHLTGAFYVNRFQINHKTFEGTFTSVQNFVRALNKWDNNVKWRFDQSTNTIFGGSTSNKYSNLELTPKGVEQAMLDIAYQEATIPTSTTIYLGQEQNNIKVERIVSGCSDEILVEIRGDDNVSLGK